MTYFSVNKHGYIVRLSRRMGQDVETPQKTLDLQCDKCGWTTKALARPMTACVCGGSLQVINTKNP